MARWRVEWNSSATASGGSTGAAPADACRIFSDGRRSASAFNYRAAALRLSRRRGSPDAVVKPETDFTLLSVCLHTLQLFRIDVFSGASSSETIRVDDSARHLSATACRQSND